jgi:hypothetical protein
VESKVKVTGDSGVKNVFLIHTMLYTGIYYSACGALVTYIIIHVYAYLIHVVMHIHTVQFYVNISHIQEIVAHEAEQIWLKVIQMIRQ